MSSNSQSSSLTSFIPLMKLGEGAFSSVYKVKRITDQKMYALKKIKISSLKEKEKINSLNEVRILASISCKYIITYKEAFFDQKLNLLCIVMEWANQGDLYHLIQTHKANRQLIPELEVWKAAYQILTAIQLLHHASILHRDLKSANIFIADGVYKLGDLNVSKVNQSQTNLAKTQTGTPYYASPEIWRDEPYGSKSDIWSFGCILYEMCCLKPPFQGQDLNQLYKNIQKGQIQNIPSIYSQELAHIINACLKQDPRERPSAQELINPQHYVYQKCQYYNIEVQKHSFHAKSSELLSTIKMPKNIKDLKNNLPDSKYDHLQTNFINDQQKVEQVQAQRSKTALLKSKTQTTQKIRDQIGSDLKIKDSNGSDLKIKDSNEKLPLPTRIKNHLNAINRVQGEKLSNIRRIQSSKQRKPYLNSIDNSQLHRNKSNINQVQEYFTPIKDQNQKQEERKKRPYSCNLVKSMEKKQQSSMEKKQQRSMEKRYQRSMEKKEFQYKLQKINNVASAVFNSDRKVYLSSKDYKPKLKTASQNYSDRKDLLQMQEDRYKKYQELSENLEREKLRCRSANIKVLSNYPSAISDLRRRLEMRSQNLQPIAQNKSVLVGKLRMNQDMPLFKNQDMPLFKNQDRPLQENIKYQVRGSNRRFEGRANIFHHARQIKNNRDYIFSKDTPINQNHQSQKKQDILEKAERRLLSQNKSAIYGKNNMLNYEADNNNVVSSYVRKYDERGLEGHNKSSNECRIKRILKGSVLLQKYQRRV